MGLQAMGLTPVGLPASSFMEMAQLRLYDALVAGRESLETGITMPLIKAFIGLASTGQTKYFTAEFDFKFTTQ
jgi:hypothetical protein